MDEKILIVDREPENRKMLEAVLADRGYRMTGVEGPNAAIEALSSEAFDLVITEAAFHEISGCDLVRRFKKLDEDMEIIFLSGFTKIENIIQTMRGHGAFDFITKPITDINRLFTAVEEALEMREAKKKGMDSKKILIVDDDPAMLKTLAIMMGKHGYQTDTAMDGFEAGVKVKEFRPGLILLDLFMKGMDGFRVCSRIKGRPETSQIKVLAITGYDTPENRKRIMEAGADGYMAKPLHMNALIRLVGSLLDPAGGEKGKD